LRLGRLLGRALRRRSRGGFRVTATQFLDDGIKAGKPSDITRDRRA
jgi:hypothetical protein